MVRSVARLDPDALADEELDLVFIARNTSEARHAEELLTERGVDYTLDFEPFFHAGIFGLGTLTGVGFFVRPSQATYCRELLRDRGLAIGVVDGE
jgi:hypothetical protein